MGEVRKLELVEVGENHRFDPAEILTSAQGQPFTTMTILGQLEDGTLWVNGDANLGETLVLLEKAKHMLVFGED